MKDRVVCRLGVSLFASVLAMTPALARAQQGSEGSARENYSQAKEVGVSGSDDEEGKHREPLYLGLDFMLGFGNYNQAVEQLPQPPNFTQSWTLDTAQIRTATFMLMGHYRFRKFGLGFRLPLVSGHIASDPAQQTVSQDIFNPGNLELSADMPHKISDTMRLIPSIALTLPTSPGDATPLTNQSIANQIAPKSANDQDALGDAYARYAIGIAAAFARGGEDDALFFNWRLGITPRAELDIKLARHTLLQPYVKIPIMIGLEQNSAAEEPLRIEAVAGIRFLQEVGPVHFGVKLVGMVPIAAARSQPQISDPMLSVWPEIRLQVTPSAQFWIAGMIPLAGDFSVFTTNPAPQNGAFNAGISATF